MRQRGHRREAEGSRHEAEGRRDYEAEGQRDCEAKTMWFCDLWNRAKTGSTALVHGSYGRTVGFCFLAYFS